MRFPRLSASRPLISGVVVCAIDIALLLFLTGCNEEDHKPEDTINRENCATSFENCRAKRCCQSVGDECYVKDATWASCRSFCTPGINPKDPPQFQTPWSCQKISLPPGASAPPRPPASPAQAPTPAPAAAARPTNDDIAASAVDALLDSAPSPPQCSAGVTEGGLSIRGLSQGGDSYLSGAGGTSAGAVLTIGHNSGFSLTRQCKESWIPDNFHEVKLIGHVMSFKVDLSKVGCACNLAFYLISTPATDASGNPSVGDCPDSPYYCDANQVCGQWCPEVDLMEANNHVFQSTVHKCDPPNANGHYSNCDRGGCAGGQNTRNMPNMYGVGPQFRIDTSKPFVVHTYFPQTAGTLSGMITIMRQEGRELTLDHSNCNVGYFSQLSNAMAEGMAVRITYWGSDPKTMSWMDQPPCGAQACGGANAGDGVISDIVIAPVGGKREPHREKTPDSAWLTWFVPLMAVATGTALAMTVWYKRASLPEPLRRSLEAQELKIRGQKLERLSPEQQRPDAEKPQERRSLLRSLDCCGFGNDTADPVPPPINTLPSTGRTGMY